MRGLLSTAIALAILIDSIVIFAYKVLFYPLNWYLGNLESRIGPMYFTPFGQMQYLKFVSPIPAIKNLTWYYMQIFLGLAKIYEKEGMFWICFGFHKRLVLFSPDYAQIILNHSKELKKSSDYEYADDLIGKGLLTSDGEVWRKQRKMCQPAFNFRRLEDYLPIVISRTKILLASLEAATSSEFIDIRFPITRCAFDCIIEVSSGIQLNSQLEDSNEIIDAVNAGLSGWMTKSAFPWWRINPIFNMTKFGKEYKKSISQLNKIFTQEVIQLNFPSFRLCVTDTDESNIYGLQLKLDVSKYENSQIGKAKNERNLDSKMEEQNEKNRKYTFVEWLLQQETGNPEDILTNKELRDQVITFVGAGYDTTAAGIIMTLYLIGLHSDVQDRLISEIFTVIGENNEGDINFEQMKNLKYLDCVLQETQRLYPSVPLIGRNLIEDLQIGSHLIPKGTDVYVYVLALQRRADSFLNPEKFDPDRFLPENQTFTRHPASYVPFSAGPRNCIGRGYSIMKSKVIITSILRKFEIKSMDARDKVFVIPDIIAKCYNEIRMNFKLRV